MKLFQRFGIILLVAINIVVSSCGGSPIEHGTQFVLQVPEGSDSADVQTTQSVIENRLNNIGLEGDFEITTEGNKITVRVRDGAIEDSLLLRRMLQSSGGLKFRSMYNSGEVAALIDTIQKTFIRINHIDSDDASTAGLAAYFVNTQYNNPSAPLLAFCRPSDTAAVNAIFSHDSIKALLPSDLVFHWGRGDYLETAGQTVSLFACKEGRNYVMNGNCIAAVKSELQNEMYEISITFDPVGAVAFSNITKANIGRSLAIELNNFVYNYPLVNAEITGGQAIITGNFTEMEAEDIEKMLGSGNLPLTFRIAEETTF